MEYGGSRPTFKIQKSFLRDIPFFLKWSQPKQAIRDFSAKKPTGFENRFRLVVRWFSG